MNQGRIKKRISVIRGSSPYDNKLNFWIEELYTLCLSMFTFKCERHMKSEKYLSREIMIRLIEDGVCGITDLSEDMDIDLYAVYVNPFEQTDYFDQYRKATFNTPYISKTRIIDADIAIIYARPTHTPLLDLIYKYAEQLAHLDTTIEVVSINMREPQRQFIATTTNVSNELKEYRNKIIKGIYKPIVSRGAMEIDSDTMSSINLDIRIIQETKQDILNEFYHLIGIKTNIEKKANMITDEIDSNDTMIEYNIDCMTDEIERGVKMVNDIFDVGMSFEKNRKVGVEFGHED